MKHSSSRLQKAIVAILVVLAVYVVSEAGYRLYKHNSLERTYRQHTRYGFSSTEAPLYLLDTQTGYSYNPNVKLHLRIYDEENNFVRENKVIVNNLGHLSPDNDSVEKPKSEFRIAILGDSFTATTPSDVTWPTALQRDLDQDAGLRKIAGKSSFKVINLGLDGTGIVQWPSVYSFKARAFHPDLVIVNFIENDIYREFIYRKTISFANGDQTLITCSSLPADFENKNCHNALMFVFDPKAVDSKAEASRFKREIYNEMVANLPWFSPYPELLAAIMRGRLGLSSRLQLNDEPLPFFKTTETALSASLGALRTIASEQKSLMILYHPTIQECLAKQAPPAVKELMGRGSDLKIENMLDFLPLTSSQEEIKKWYNLPYDEHPSDYGAEVYARAVQGRIHEYLSHANVTALK